MGRRREVAHGLEKEPQKEKINLVRKNSHSHLQTLTHPERAEILLTDPDSESNSPGVIGCQNSNAKTAPAAPHKARQAAGPLLKLREHCTFPIAKLQQPLWVYMDLDQPNHW